MSMQKKNPRSSQISCPRRAVCRKIKINGNECTCPLHTCVFHAALDRGAAPGTGSLAAGARGAFLPAGSGSPRGRPLGFRYPTLRSGAGHGVSPRPCQAPHPGVGEGGAASFQHWPPRLQSHFANSSPAAARGRSSVGARTRRPALPSPPSAPLATRAAWGPRLPWVREPRFRARGEPEGPETGPAGISEEPRPRAPCFQWVRAPEGRRGQSQPGVVRRGAGAVVAGKVCALRSARRLRSPPGRARGCRVSRGSGPSVATRDPALVTPSPLSRRDAASTLRGAGNTPPFPQPPGRAPSVQRVPAPEVAEMLCGAWSSLPAREEAPRVAHPDEGLAGVDCR